MEVTQMFYMPIIKLKAEEIRLSTYIKDSITNENIIPFLELIYELDNNRKNTTLDEFLKATGCNFFFVGIPHNPIVIKTDDGKKLVTKANKDNETYYNETIKLFEIKHSIPVFYVYSEEDIDYANSFLQYAQSIKKAAAVITTTNYATQLDQDLLTRNVYLMLDIGKDELGPKRIVIKSCTNNNANIIIVRENRDMDTMNNIIKTDAHVPLLEDLSCSIERLKNNLNFKISGFGDYCGYKNVATLKGGGGNRDKMFPAWAMYRRDESNPYYLGICSDKSLTCGGFKRLVELSLERLTKIDINNPCIKILKEKPMTTYGPWNVLTEWNYIYQMSKYDGWSEISTLE